jgi:hypothetical protein
MYIAFEYPEPLQLTRFCHKQMPAVNSDTISIIACLISFYNMKYSKQLEDLLVTLYDSLFDYSMQYSEESHIIFESLL